ncbi:MAG: hypothetical protein K2X82_15065 [Gemmataceae bacterium]|nr:hypothetical protein [Gemmataceae bacterium]
MTITLTLPAGLERRLARQAAADGTTVEAAAVALLEKAAPPEKTFEEAAAAIHAAFAASGRTDEEIDADLAEALEEVRAEKRARREGRA